MRRRQLDEGVKKPVSFDRIKMLSIPFSITSILIGRFPQVTQPKMAGVIPLAFHFLYNLCRILSGCKVRRKENVVMHADDPLTVIDKGPVHQQYNICRMVPCRCASEVQVF